MDKSEGTESLCASPECVSLRRELTTIFGVPVVREGETWNDAMLRWIADTRGNELRQAQYARSLLKNADGALSNLLTRMES